MTRFQSLTKSLNNLQDTLNKPSHGFDEMRKGLIDISRKLDDSQRSDILNWVSPMPYESAHNQFSRKAHPGTASWLLQHPDYVKWANSDSDSVFWLRGFMGSGKSCVTHEVIKTLIEEAQPQTAVVEKVLYFYCDGTDIISNKDVDEVTRIVRCLKELADNGRKNALNESLIAKYQ